LNRESLSKLIKNPSLLTSQDEAELKQMIKVYPYFQTLYALYAKANSTSENIERAAVRTLDRDLLRNVITKDFNPNKTDSFANLLKNTEQVNAFEKLKAKITEEPTPLPDKIAQEDVKETTVIFDYIEAPVTNILSDNQDDFKTSADNFFIESEANIEDKLLDKIEPIYNPFANDIFDKDLSNNEITIDEDIKLQTPLDYDDDLVKPLSEYDIEDKLEYTNLQPQNYITSTDNFFEEAILQADSEKEEIKKIDLLENFFEIPDFEEIEKPIELIVFEEESQNKSFESSHAPVFASENVEKSEWADNEKVSNEKLESSFFDLSDDLMKPIITEDKLVLLDTYYLRKKEEGEDINRLAHEIISNEIAHNEVFMGDAVLSITSKIDLLDAYYLRKEEETLGTDRLNHEIISNEIAHNEIITDELLFSITKTIDLLDTYYLRKEEEIADIEPLAHDKTTTFVESKLNVLDTYYLRKEEEMADIELLVHNETTTFVESKLDVLDTYYLRKEEEMADIELLVHNETTTFVESKLNVLDTYYLRKEEEMADIEPLVYDKTTTFVESKLDVLDTYYLRKEEEMADIEPLVYDKTTTFVESKLDVLDTYYLRKEEEKEPIVNGISGIEHSDNVIEIAVATNENIDFFAQLGDKEDLRAVEDIDFLNYDEVQFFEIPDEEILKSFNTEEVDSEFDTTNFFDDHEHEPTYLTTGSKPIYKKASQEYQRNLIDKFIKESPAIQIDRNKLTEDFVDLAEDSTKDNLEIASEYLAKIYAKQGNKAKAIEVYQRLSLKNPERGGYFESQIENLRNS
jgi:hypothetical protein